MDSAEIGALFARMLEGDSEDEGAWNAASSLSSSGDREVFDRAAEWCASESPRKRSMAACILSQLHAADGDIYHPVWLFRDESYALLTKMLERESDTAVLEGVLIGLGHLARIDAISAIARYSSHDDPKLRQAVAYALGSTPNEPRAVEVLLELTADPDAEVRDWAVFGLGVQGQADSPEIRQALLRCLDDKDENVREEAAHGLGNRRDRRMLPKLMEMLNDPEGVKTRVGETASALLGLDQDPPDWEAADYKDALRREFAVE